VKEGKIKNAVKEGYTKIATQKKCCCDSSNISEGIGYSAEELKSVPQSADLGLGCGNPVALASLKEGETVIDLGSGGGLDCFLAANKVGKKGRVIGIDMTPEMIGRATKTAEKNKYTNVEFRLGEIEKMPVEDGTADVIISNCVINLSTNKSKTFKEAFRVLKPGGRLMISDIVLLKQLPESIKRSIEAYVGCLAGAIMKDKYMALIRETGFRKEKVIQETQFPIEYMANDPTAKAIIKKSEVSQKELAETAHSVASIKVYAEKPH
jgi:arsenite methyltransferase